jgi:hypothetical protein
MNRSRVFLTCGALTILAAAPWWALSGDDIPGEAADADETSTTQQLREQLEEALVRARAEVEDRRQKLREFLVQADSLPVQDIAQARERVNELAHTQRELELELFHLDLQIEMARSRHDAEQAIIAELESLHREAVDLAAQRVDVLKEGVERTQALVDEGVASVSAVSDMQAQLHTAGIEHVEQRIALTEIQLRRLDNPLDEIAAAKEVLMARIDYVKSEYQRQSSELSEAEIQSLQYEQLKADVERAEELMSRVAEQLDSLDVD